MANTAVAPYSGSTVPPDPTLYVFVPSFYADDVKANVRVTAGGEALAFDTTVVSKTDAFWAFRIVVSSGNSKSITLHYGAEKTATYAVDSSWRRQRATPPAARVYGAEYVQDMWTCSHTDAHFLTLSDAPAYRVEWSRVAGGELHTVVFPHHLDDFWMWGDQQPTTGPGKIGLGHLNCMGESAESGTGYGTRFVRVTPLFPDGSSGWQWETPLQIDQRGIATTADPPPPPQQQQRSTHHRRLAATSHGADWLPLLGLAAFVFGYALTRSRMRRATATTRDRLATLARYSIPQVLCAVTAMGAIWLALHAATTLDAGAGFGFSVAAATWAVVAGATAALARASQT